MKKYKIENLLHSKGYVSVEILIVSGLIIATGAFLISKLVWKGKDVATSSNNNVNNAGKRLDDNLFDNGDSTTPGDSGSIITPGSDTNNPIVPAIPEIPVKNLEYKETTDGIIITRYHKPKIQVSKKLIDKGHYSSFDLTNEEVLKGNISNASFYSNSPTFQTHMTVGGAKESDNLYKYELSPLFNDRDDGHLCCSLNIQGTSYLIFNYEYNGVGEIKLPKENYVKDLTFDMYEKSSIAIPSKINGKPVVGIGDFAFLNKNIDNVVIPNTVKSIGECAFAGNQLKELAIPNSVETIKEKAFLNNNLTSISMPNKFNIDKNKYFGELKNVEFKLT